jgi:hypothetical protein
MVSSVNYVGMSVQHAIRLRENKLDGIAFTEVEYQGQRYQPTSFEDGHLIVWLLPDMKEPILAPTDQCVLTRPWPVPSPRVLPPSRPWEENLISRIKQRWL